MQNMSDYNALREQNIAKRNAIFAKFFNDVNKIKEEEETFQKVNNINENEPPKKRRRVSHNDKKDNTFRSSSRLEFHKEYNTRSRAKVGKNINTLNDSENSDNTSDDDSKNNETTKLVKKKKPNLRKVLPWAKHFQNGIADITKTEVNEEEEKESEGKTDDDDEDKEYNYNNNLLLSPDRPKRKKKSVKKTKRPNNINNIPSADEITQEMIDNVAKSTTAKEYSSIYGTSCHQCRQKTMDTKTICRSGECFGKRGQFCGPCLQGRYGEDVVTSLKDPKWACPPCRGLCNCSVCRSKNGLRPTGILVPTVQGEGYSSVMDYLKSVENKNNKEDDDDGDDDDDDDNSDDDDDNNK